MDQTIFQLDQDVDLGIIEPVPAGTPTTWCARMITVPKSDGTPRRTVGLQDLNEATKRETHHTQSPFHLVNTIPTNSLKSKLDAWNGYHSIPLAEWARDETTFITEWGRYRCLRACPGFHASNDAYTKCFDDITIGYPRVKRIVDDSILWNADIASSFWHVVDYIKLCGDNGVVFNPSKFEFAMEVLDFASFTLTMDRYKPSVKLMDAIKNFPSPTNILDKQGIGFTLVQKDCTCPTVNQLCGDGHWKTVFAGSRFTTPAESRYAPIKGEALALLYALNSCRMFIMGCPDLLVAVDHKPLIRIFNNHNIEPAIVASIKLQMESSLSIDSIITESRKDPVYQELINVIENGFPNRNDQLSTYLREYWNFLNELYCSQ